MHARGDVAKLATGIIAEQVGFETARRRTDLSWSRIAKSRHIDSAIDRASSLAMTVVLVFKSGSRVISYLVTKSSTAASWLRGVTNRWSGAGGRAPWIRSVGKRLPRCCDRWNARAA